MSNAFHEYTSEFFCSEMILISKNLVALKKPLQINLYVVCTPIIQWILVQTTTNILEMVTAVLHSLCTTTDRVVFLIHDQPFVRDAFPFFISSNCTSHSNIISTIGAPRRPMTNNDQPSNPCPLIVKASGKAHLPTRSSSRGLHVIYQQEFISQDSGSLILKIQMRRVFIFQDQKSLKV